MTSENQCREKMCLPPTLDKQLLGYATAAGAAGVALLAAVQPAEAKIVYTAANIPIVTNGGPVQLDVNNDGVADFSFYAASGSPGAFGKRSKIRPPLGGFFAYIGVGPAAGQTGNEVGATTSFLNVECAAEIPGETKVGAGRNFKSGFLDMFAAGGDYTSPGTAACPWRGNNKANQGGFIALKFVVSGQTYYGWAHISRTGTYPTITGYAYENSPGASIKTGQNHGPSDESQALPAPSLGIQPASLGALALGASGLQLWRRPDDQA